MKFLKCVTWIWFTASAIAFGSSDEDVFDFERIKTTYGRTYEKVFVLTADQHGLLFRHAAGIAKLSFSELPMNLRMLYEPVEPGEQVAEEPVETEKEEEKAASSAPLYFIQLVRPQYYVIQQSPGYCRSQINYWPRHWPRYHPAHAYARPACRELVVRDFLYTTGLACKPPGVVTRRLPYRRPYLIQ